MDTHVPKLWYAKKWTVVRHVASDWSREGLELMLWILSVIGGHIARQTVRALCYTRLANSNAGLLAATIRAIPQSSTVTT
jgi:hypothetical protein